MEIFFLLFRLANSIVEAHFLADHLVPKFFSSELPYAKNPTLNLKILVDFGQKSTNLLKIPQKSPKIGVFEKIWDLDVFGFSVTATYGLTTGAGIFQKKYKTNFFFGAEKKVFSKIQRGDHSFICQFSLGPPFRFRGLEIFIFLFSVGLRGCDDGIIREAKPRRTSPPQAPSEARYTYILQGYDYTYS